MPALATTSQRVTVQSGMTLWALAEQYYGDGADWPKIYAANPQLRPNPNSLVTGKTVVVPPLISQPVNKAYPAIVVATIAAELGTALTPSLASATIAKAMSLTSKVERSSLETTLEVIDRYPSPRMEGIGPAQREVNRLNDMRRAAFVLASYRRVQAQQSQNETHDDILKSEQRFYAQHFTAATNRMQAANKIDGMSWKYGTLLGWYAQKDSRTTPDCLNADGKNFSAIIPPRIGWPGIVHVQCRCQPGKPFLRGEILR